MTKAVKSGKGSKRSTRQKLPTQPTPYWRKRMELQEKVEAAADLAYAALDKAGFEPFQILVRWKKGRHKGLELVYSMPKRHKSLAYAG